MAAKTPDNPSPIVLGIGELLWDCFADGRRPGGAPANVAFHAAQLGMQGVVASRVGSDPLGEELRAYLGEHDLPVDYVQVDPLRQTGTVTVDMRSPDQPEYTIHDEVAWDFLEFDAGLAAIAPRATAICFGTLAQRHEGTRATIQRVLETAPTALAVYDVNLRQEWYSRAIIEHSLRAATVVKLNESEVQTIGPLLGIPIEPLSFASNIRERYGVMLVCVTRGEQGCALFAADASAEHGGVAITVADAVGAGDAFTAALIFSLVEKWTLATSAAFANHIGALVAARPGAMPELGSEYASLVQRARTGHLSE